MAALSPEKKKRTTTLTPEDFTAQPEVREAVAKVLADFKGTQPKIVSDVIDDAGHQYVNLVQKGGGVLGIALVGYTYVLEQAGIRFLKLAGTSAGAINTSLMTILKEKEEAKSEAVIQILCDLDFFSFVDGHPAARWLIRNFITHEDFNRIMLRWAIIIGSMLVLLPLLCFVFFGLQHQHPVLAVITQTVFGLTALGFVALCAFSGWVGSLLSRLKNAGFGINPGDTFYDWIKKIFEANGIHTVEDLTTKARKRPASLRVRENAPQTMENLDGDVTFITAELVTQNKIQFPAMYNLFRAPGDKPIHPAGFVRASMSIPVFFESYMIPDINCTRPEIVKAWADTFFEKDPPGTARFVDGGVLSNFPMNLFYNPALAQPRLPTFGIDLDDSDPNDKTKNPYFWTGGGYLGRVFNTIRFYYDKDFLIKNSMYQAGVGSIPLQRFKWLNFFLDNQDKVDMFICGAQAAQRFLAGFKWEDYKQTQVAARKQLS